MGGAFLQKIEKSGTLRFWGDWFGRPYDNFHTVVNHELSENLCILYFNNGEICTIIDPIGIISNPTTFHITDASSIKWQWYLYGEPKLEKNMRIISYVRNHETITVKNGSSPINRSFSPKGFYALEIV